MPRTGQNLVVLTGGWVAGWVAGSNGNNANSASIEVEVEAELGNIKPYASGGRYCLQN